LLNTINVNKYKTELEECSTFSQLSTVLFFYDFRIYNIKKLPTESFINRCVHLHVYNIRNPFKNVLRFCID